MLDEIVKERELRCAAIAKEKGFSSWDEYEKKLMMEDHQAHLEAERRLDEKCALLGKTREQLHKEDPQRYSDDDDDSDGGGCDCEGELLTTL